jgi:DNA processing protein
MACDPCKRRSALIAALAPAISSLSLSRVELLGLLALPDAKLLRAAKVEEPRDLRRRLELPLPCDSVPTALCRHDPEYPEALAQLPSAPAVLYASCSTGRLTELLGKPTVAIVGSRDHTSYGRERTCELARDLARAGVTVVSGVNEGLEGIAHRGALHARGSTIAVMACSPDRFHLNHGHQLHRRILGRGAAVAELPPKFFPPQPWCFIASQRIIAALASVVVVVEAGARSCVLFTAEIAANLGADIAVVPGRVTDPGGKWLCELMRDGARPVGCAQDVIEVIYGMGVRGVAASRATP